MCLLAVCAYAQPAPELRGTVTDPSGAAVPGAAVQARGAGGNHRTRTNASGQYAFTTMAPGRYRVQVTAKGFATVSVEIAVEAPVLFDAHLAIQASRQRLVVEDRSNGVTSQPDANAGAQQA